MTLYQAHATIPPKICLNKPQFQILQPNAQNDNIALQKELLNKILHVLT